MNTPFSRPALIAQLTGEEASRAFVYDDATGAAIRSGVTCHGNPTIGVGRNLAAKGLSPDEVAYMLNNDVDEAAADLDRAFPWWRGMPDPQQRALLDLRFNMGLAGLEGFHNFLAAMEAGEWVVAAQQLQQSAWWHQVGTRGPRVVGLILTVVYQDDPGAASE